jgi:LEA14-like dessication related protein
MIDMTRRGILCAFALALFGCGALGPRPQPPDATVDAITFAQVAADGAQLSLRLAVRNPNAFVLDVAALDYGFAIEERSVAAGKLPRGVRLAASATTMVDTDLRIDFAAFRAAVEGVVQRGKVRYELTGTAVLGDGTQLPFKRNGELDTAKVRGLRN